MGLGSPEKREVGREPCSGPNLQPIPILHFGVCRWWWRQLFPGAVRCPKSIRCRSWGRSSMGEPGGREVQPTSTTLPTWLGSETKLRC